MRARTRRIGRAGLCFALASWLSALGVATAAQGDGQKPPAGTDERPRARETVTVTATLAATPAEDLASTVVAIDAETLRARPATSLDEALAWEPSFSLFRRTPARAAHPTAQGLNLRGVGPSGTSRAAVWVDGVPLTDAFGGWVPWARLPSLAIRRVEIAPGSASAPAGSGALGGLLQIETVAPGQLGPLRVRLGGGSLGTWNGGFAAGLGRGGARAVLAGEAFTTSGYVAVAPDRRGPVDRPLTTRHANGWLRAALPGAWSVTLDGFGERRGNGTREQRNRTWSVGAALAWQPIDGAWSARGHARRRVFRSRFSRILPGRFAEIAVLQQRVPSWDAGARVQAWWHAGTRYLLAAGVDARRVSGRSEETVLSIGLRRAPGGAQLLGGGYLSGRLQGARFALEGSLRADGWRNRPRGDGEVRSAARLSPRLGAVWHAAAAWRLHASVAGGFRAPTLNELYRQFRVGDVLTRANPALHEEIALTTEVGAAWSGAAGGDRRVEIGLDWYRTRLQDAVVNVTLARTEQLVLRERRNVGRATTSGLELRGRLTAPTWTLTWSAAWMRSRLDGAGAGDPIDGKRAPQVPRVRATVAVEARPFARAQALVALHAVGRQYEDDRNELPLAGGVTLDAGLRFRLGEATYLLLNGQNLTGARLQVGRTPVPLLGPPRTLAAVLEVDLPGGG